MQGFIENTFQSYLGRQPILNSSHHVIGYELLFRNPECQSDARFSCGTAATATVLMNFLGNMGMDAVVGNKKAFINFDREMLASDIIDILPKDRVVLEFLEHISPEPEIIERCQKLASEGFVFALDDFIYRGDCCDSLLKFAKLVKIDLLVHDDESLKEHVQLCQDNGLEMLAEKVESYEVFRRCKELGFSLFQGYFFTKPVTLSRKDIPADKMSVLRLMDEVRRTDNLQQLASEISLNLAICYKLLRFINSAGLSRGRKIEQVGDAVIMLGKDRLYRWLSLLLYAESNQDEGSALFSTALVRGRMMEVLGEEKLPGHAGNLFVTGMFSLLEALLDMPMTHVLREIELPQAISDALLENSGPCAPFLELVRTLETGDADTIHALSVRLGLDSEHINRAQMEAAAFSRMVLE